MAQPLTGDGSLFSPLGQVKTLTRQALVRVPDSFIQDSHLVGTEASCGISDQADIVVLFARKCHRRVGFLKGFVFTKLDDSVGVSVCAYSRRLPDAPARLSHRRCCAVSTRYGPPHAPLRGPAIAAASLATHREFDEGAHPDAKFWMVLGAVASPPLVTPMGGANRNAKAAEDCEAGGARCARMALRALTE